jgi:hypothetical protein
MARHIRHYENIHIPLWLIKDTCWMLEWKVLGTLMIIPTVSVAIYITIRSFRETEFFINLAVCFWIFANAFWMCCEFYGYIEYKNVAGIPFLFGMICTIVFYVKNRNVRII